VGNRIIRLINHAVVYVRTLFSDGPNYLIFFITGRCNLRCSFCFYLEEIENADKERELTLQEITKIARRCPVLYHITFTGGETFLRDDIDEIVKIFYRFSNTRSITITTNGTYPERVGKMVEEMAKSCPNLIVRVPLSLDGFEEVHDKIRGMPGIWKKVLHTYELLRVIADKYSNVKIDVTSVLQKANLDNIETLVHFVSNNMRVENHAINYPRGAIQEKENILPEELKYKEIINRSSETRKQEKYQFPFFSRLLILMRGLTEMAIMEIQRKKKMPFVCQAGTSLIEMNEYGELFPCETLDTLIKDKETLRQPEFKESWMGNVRDHNYDIKQVMKSAPARRVNSFIQNEGCACTFECAIGASLVFKPTNIFKMQLQKIKSSLFGPPLKK
jgi:MoaA/NifB/PqqE/SkfB family radical SAM enzyme